MNDAERTRRIRETRRSLAQLNQQRRTAVSRRNVRLAYTLARKIQERERELRQLTSAPPPPPLRPARRPLPPPSPNRGGSPPPPSGGERRAPRGVHDPYQNVAISAGNAAWLAKFYQRKLRQLIVTPKERTWWSSRLSECGRFLRAGVGKGGLRARAGELRRKAGIARAKKRYAQAAEFDAQAEKLQSQAVDWTTDGDGFVAPKDGDDSNGEASVEASVDASLSVDTPWYTSWWFLLGIAGVGAVVVLRGRKGKGVSSFSPSSSSSSGSSPSGGSGKMLFRRKV